MQKQIKTLGILGGLGPMATVYFYEMLTEHTKAESDQEHIDMIISSRATTPDRTAFVLGKSEENPLDIMKEEAEKLIRSGADIISVPCNTAHYFYDALSESCSVPIINIIRETVEFVRRKGVRKIGILATEGTVLSGAYERVCRELEVGYEAPDKEHQQLLTEIIYGEIKQGRDADMEKFQKVADHMKAKGCEALILGCTELSLIAKKHKLGMEFVDSLSVLAIKTILLCGKTPVGFPAEMLENF